MGPKGRDRLRHTIVACVIMISCPEAIQDQIRDALEGFFGFSINLDLHGVIFCFLPLSTDEVGEVCGLGYGEERGVGVEIEVAGMLAAHSLHIARHFLTLLCPLIEAILPDVKRRCERAPTFPNRDCPMQSSKEGVEVAKTGLTWKASWIITMISLFPGAIYSFERTAAYPCM